MQRYGVVQPSSKTISSPSPRESTQSDEQTIAPLSAVQILRSSTIDLSSLRLVRQRSPSRCTILMLHMQVLDGRSVVHCMAHLASGGEDVPRPPAQDAGVIEANVFAWTAAFHPTQAKVAVVRMVGTQDLQLTPSRRRKAASPNTMWSAGARWTVWSFHSKPLSTCSTWATTSPSHLSPRHVDVHTVVSHSDKNTRHRNAIS